MLSGFSSVRLFVILWTVAHQAPLSMGLFKQECWSRLLCPPPGDLPNPGIEPPSPAALALQVDSLPFEPPGKLGKCQFVVDHGWRRQWHPTPVLLPGKSHGRRAWWAVVHGVPKSRTRLSDFTFTFHFHALEKEMATPPVFLPGESQGWGSLVGCRLWGRTESDTTEAT